MRYIPQGFYSRGSGEDLSPKPQKSNLTHFETQSQEAVTSDMINMATSSKSLFAIILIWVVRKCDSPPHMEVVLHDQSRE